MPVDRIEIRLLGGFAATAAGGEVPRSAWRLRKARELVKLLALAPGRRLHREQAMDALWPDRGPSSAANNLHQAVHVARRALGAGSIESRDETLVLHADVDADAFALAAAAARRSRTAEAYDRALAAYGGELLPENRYDDWAVERREELAALRDELAAARAALGTEPPARRTLRAETSSFVGRERELSELRALLRKARLLTLTGTGGTGKTRLALELGREAGPSFADGVVLAELGAVADGTLVPDEVACGLDVHALPGELLVDAIAAEVAERELLLVLDNCEHVLDGAAALADALLRSAPRLAILATSREPLRVPGEVVFRVPSLAIPDPEREQAPAGLGRFEAVRLFVERAQGASPGFELDASNAADVARICFRLDGLPLALELAAGRLGALDAGAIAARLDDRFRLLRAGSRTAPDRQQTLAATLDWSHDLLARDEAVLLRRLAPFAGGFELEAAEGVASGDGLDRRDVADVLGRLVEKSLVTVDERPSGRRYRLLETIREYAAARLDEADESERAARAHARWALALAEAERDSPRLDAESANLRAALDTLLAHEPLEALRLCTAVWPFWLRRIELAEAERRLDDALTAAPERTALRAEALLAAAAIDFRAGNTGYGSGKARESLEIARELADPAAEWRATQFIGETAVAADDAATARRYFRQSLVLARRHHRAAAEAMAVYSLGVACWLFDDLAGADEHLGRALEAFRALAGSDETVPAPVNMAEWLTTGGGGGGLRLVFEETLNPFVDVSCREAVGYVLANRAHVARSAGDARRARALLEEARRHFDELGGERGRADVLARLANVALAEARPADARRLFERALELRRAVRDLRGVGLALVGIGTAATAAGETAAAEAHLADACGLFRRAGDRWGLAAALWRTADLALARGRPDEAEAGLEEALRALDQTGRIRWQGFTRTILADAVELRGDRERAVAVLAQARRDFAAAGDRRGIRHVEERLDALAKRPLRERKAAAGTTSAAQTTRGRRRR